MLNNRSVLSWYFYDVGASAFATVIMAVVLPVFYQTVVVHGDGEWAMATWGYASSCALFLSAVLTPLTGTYIDGRPVKKKSLAAFAVLGAISSAALAASGEGTWLFTLCFLVLGTVGLSVAAVCYDALLP